jgi:hypothetical protein
MRLATMQPYFFPYIGYYSLIEYADKFIIFDSVQYIRHGWINRNRILKPEDGWQYIKVPLRKHSREILIKDIIIENKTNWQDKILGQLEHYKKKAPHYNSVRNLVCECLLHNEESIVNLNANCLEKTCAFLGMQFNYEIFSNMKLHLENVQEPDEWALKISQVLNAKEYINPCGGFEIFDEQKYKTTNIELKFLKNRLAPYDQRRRVFENGLSILDVLMFNSPDEAIKMIQDFQFL